MKQIGILSILSASAFYLFCPHPHFTLFIRTRNPHLILFVRIRILSIVSAFAFYSFCPHPHFILFVRPSACPSVSAFYPNP
jgi:hypothetical protein